MLRLRDLTDRVVLASYIRRFGSSVTTKAVPYADTLYSSTFSCDKCWTFIETLLDKWYVQSHPYPPATAILVAHALSRPLRPCLGTLALVLPGLQSAFGVVVDC